MISNNLTFLALNLHNGLPKNNQSSRNSNKIAIKHRYDEKLKKSHDNLFNFINDNSINK